MKFAKNLNTLPKIPKISDVENLPPNQYDVLE